MGAMTQVGGLLASTGIAAPLGFGMMAAGALFGGLAGQSKANKLADIQSQSVAIQNQIYAKEFDIQRSNMLQQRRAMFRQGAAATAGATVMATASGSFRSTGFADVKRDIQTTTEQNVGQIDTALRVGSEISTLKQQQATLQSQAAKTQAQGSFLDSIF